MEQFEQEKVEFEEWAEKVKDTNLRLNLEREKVLQEKAEYDYEREALEKWKQG